GHRGPARRRTAARTSPPRPHHPHRPVAFLVPGGRGVGDGGGDRGRLSDLGLDRLTSGRGTPGTRRTRVAGPLARLCCGVTYGGLEGEVQLMGARPVAALPPAVAADPGRGARWRGGDARCASIPGT